MFLTSKFEKLLLFSENAEFSAMIRYKPLHVEDYVSRLNQQNDLAEEAESSKAHRNLTESKT